MCNQVSQSEFMIDDMYGRMYQVKFLSNTQAKCSIGMPLFHYIICLRIIVIDAHVHYDHHRLVG